MGRERPSKMLIKQRRPPKETKALGTKGTGSKGTPQKLPKAIRRLRNRRVDPPRPRKTKSPRKPHLASRRTRTRSNRRREIPNRLLPRPREPFTSMTSAKLQATVTVSSARYVRALAGNPKTTCPSRKGLPTSYSIECRSTDPISARTSR